MRIAIGADHAGFVLKDEVHRQLAAAGHTVVDFGTDNSASTDYPDYAKAVGKAVAAGEAERGILVCSTGVGVSIAANKIHGVRAVQGFHDDEVRLSREHNDSNVLTLGARYITTEVAQLLIQTFLETAFSKGERHMRRITKVAAMEAEHYTK